MTVALIVGTIRTVADTVDDPAEILSILNRRLHGRLKDGFVTCQALRLTAEGDGVLANAGHPAPFLNRDELDLPGALPLGLDPDTAYETDMELTSPSETGSPSIPMVCGARNPPANLQLRSPAGTDRHPA